MFYETATKGHGLRNDPFKALVVPRPIGWITTIDRQGRINLAPFSFFNAIAEDPPMVLFAPGGRKADRPVKDSRANVEETGEFVCNLATWDLRDAMNLTSANLAAGEDEMKHAKLTPVPSRLVKPPRVKESPVALECKYWKTVELPVEPGNEDKRGSVVFGQVVGVHIDDAILKDGRVDTLAFKPVARLGYSEYTTTENVWRMRRPDDPRYQ